jgi:hypothetical protein
VEVIVRHSVPTLCVYLLLLLPGTVSINAADAKSFTKFYDIADLLTPVPDFTAIELGITTEPVNEALPLGETPTENQAAIPAKATLVTPISVELANSLFEPGIATLVRQQGTLAKEVLTLNATPELHHHVEQALNAARKRRHLQVHISTQLVLMNPKSRQSRYTFPGLNWRAIPDQPGLAFATLPSSEAAAALAAMASEDSKNFTADGVVYKVYPTFTTYSGQLANTSLITTKTFKRPSLIATFPTLLLGDTLSVRATPTTDRAFLTVDVTHARCALLEMKEIDLGDAGTGEEPILWHGTERLTTTIPVGQSIIIATGTYLDAEKPLNGFLFITPELMDVETPKSK